MTYETTEISGKIVDYGMSDVKKKHTLYSYVLFQTDEGNEIRVNNLSVPIELVDFESGKFVIYKHSKKSRGATIIVVKNKGRAVTSDFLIQGSRRLPAIFWLGAFMLFIFTFLTQLLLAPIFIGFLFLMRSLRNQQKNITKAIGEFNIHQVRTI
jgi:hypothetical protein